MNADAFRHLYDYHFSENRIIWDRYVAQLSDEQFTQDAAYSKGSVRNQLAHMVEADEMWFSGLRGVEIPEPPNPDQFADHQLLRARWDGVEQDMRAYLAELDDEMLFTHPLQGGDELLVLWQVLIHVINHGTDHRAQVLRLLNDLGVETIAQDYIFYIFNNA